MEQEYAQPEETTQKKYIRNYTEEGREKQKNHLNNIRQKAMEKKRELKEITSSNTISIQNLTNEFLKIHLESFLKYLEKNSFDLFYTDVNKNFKTLKNGKIKQINDIKKFLLRHQN